MWIKSQDGKMLIDAHEFNIKFSSPYTRLYADGVVIGKYKNVESAKEMMMKIEDEIVSSKCDILYVQEDHL